MKKKLIYCLAAVALLAVGCSKQKTCRCSVIGTSTVRIVKIDGGEQLRMFNLHTSLDSLQVDSLVCTDYEFAIDSIFTE